MAGTETLQEGSPITGEDVTAYCVRCKTKKPVKDPILTIMKNGRPAAKGTCHDCGTGLYSIRKSS